MKHQKPRYREVDEFDLNSIPLDKQREIEILIEAAYNSTDPVKKANFKKLFGDKKPTIQEFIKGVAGEIRRRQIN